MTIPTYYCAGCYESKESVYANLYIAREKIPVCGYSCMNNALRANKVIQESPMMALTRSVWVEIVGCKAPTPTRVYDEEQFSPLTRSPKMENVNDFYTNDDDQIESLGKKNE
jgi:hypothetical protein